MDLNVAYIVVETETAVAQRWAELKQMNLNCVNGAFFHKIFITKKSAENFVKTHKKNGQLYFICEVEIDTNKN